MARSRFTVGTRYKHDKEVFVVRELLLDSKLLIENQSFGGVAITTQAELTASWARGEICFEIHGPTTRKPRDIPIVTEFTVVDFERLPANRRDEARRRLDIIRPLLHIPSEERTREYIDQYAASLRSSMPDLPECKDKKEGRRKGRCIGKAVGRSSIEKWIKDFIDSGCDLRALVPKTNQHGGKGKLRLNNKDEEAIKAVLETCKKYPAKRTIEDVHLMVVNHIVDNQGKRPPEDLPGETTVYRRIRAEGYASIIRRRLSPLEVQKDKPSFPGPSPTRILERVEIDDTWLDFIVVDFEDRLPIGRPTITFAIDAYSDMPCGIYVGFDPPSYLTVQACLYHSILPKPDCQQIYGTKHSWPVYGLPETLIVDNGPHYAGHNLDYACEQLGIILERMPVKKPWFKGTVEGFFHADNRGLIHTLPGTTFSNVLERGDYDSFRHACISLQGFMELLHVFFLDKYAIEWHEGISKHGGVPMKMWEESMLSGYIPCLHHNIKDLRYILYPGEERTIQRGGIDFQALVYQSPALAPLRSYLRNKLSSKREQSQEDRGKSRDEKVHIKYDPEDLSMLYVYDPRPDHEDWLPVPAVDQEYTEGLSIYKHRIIRNYVLRQKKEVDIYELAEAKRHIQDIADREYGLTQRGRGRKQLARYRGIKTEPTPSVPNNTSFSSTCNEQIHVEPQEKNNVASTTSVPITSQPSQSLDTTADQQRSRKSRRKKDYTSQQKEDTPPSCQKAEPETLSKSGWGGDYGLP